MEHSRDRDLILNTPCYLQSPPPFFFIYFLFFSESCTSTILFQKIKNKKNRLYQISHQSPRAMLGSVLSTESLSVSSPLPLPRLKISFWQLIKKQSLKAKPFFSSYLHVCHFNFLSDLPHQWGNNPIIESVSVAHDGSPNNDTGHM